MDIINLIGGLLYQWDTGRKVKIESPSCINVDEVHFTNDMQDALVVEPKSADNVYYAEIPNILLQDKRKIKVYVVTRTETGEQTVCCRGLTVDPRQKPADYIYTETELKRWESLDERIKALEEGGVGGSADAVLYTEQELTEEQKAVARENIGAVGAPQTAEVGQVISVKAVDDEGKPTEWECADRVMTPGEAVKIVEITLDADMASTYGVEFTTEEYPELNKYNVLHIAMKASANAGSPWIETKVNGVLINRGNNVLSNGGGRHLRIWKRGRYYKGSAEFMNPSLVDTNLGVGTGSILIGRQSPKWVNVGENIESVSVVSWTTFLDEGTVITIHGWNE